MRIYYKRYNKHNTSPLMSSNKRAKYYNNRDLHYIYDQYIPADNNHSLYANIFLLIKCPIISKLLNLLYQNVKYMLVHIPIHLHLVNVV